MDQPAHFNLHTSNELTNVRTHSCSIERQAEKGRALEFPFELANAVSRQKREAKTTRKSECVSYLSTRNS